MLRLQEIALTSLMKAGPIYHPSVSLKILASRYRGEGASPLTSKLEAKSYSVSFSLYDCMIRFCVVSRVLDLGYLPLSSHESRVVTLSIVYSDRFSVVT